MTKIMPVFVFIEGGWAKVGKITFANRAIESIEFDEHAPLEEALRAMIMSRGALQFGNPGEYYSNDEPTEAHRDENRPQITVTPAPRVTPSVQERMGYTRPSGPSRQAWPK